ncbi:universal stress protein [Sulfitobacter sp. JB4-11]|uniref:universal stress protein n=1 Tax=Sulfitobacter rhodophyticola TaxID=3238304 RepID=UPI003517619B
MFHTILVAYDGSDHAQHALKTAAGLAKIHGAALHLVHTPQIDSPHIVIGAFISQLEHPPTAEQIEAAGKHITDKAVQEVKAEGVNVSGIHISNDSPAPFILDTAQKTQADLIVLGRRGLGSLTALALGSVSQAVSHGAKCACLTVI